MVVAGINNYTSTINFGAKTRSEREAARQQAEERNYVAQVTAEEIRMIQKERDRIKTKNEQQNKKPSYQQVLNQEEKEYKDNVKLIKETQKSIKDVTHSDKDKNILAGKTLRNIGNVMDIVITGTLSGLALHWSTGKTFLLLNEARKLPKVAKVINNIKRPFQIVGSSIGEGAQTAWNSMARKVKATEGGKKFVNSAPIKKLNEGLEKISTSYKNFKTDAKNLKAEDIKSGVATVFGVSGFAAGVVEKIDTPDKKSKGKKNADNAD